MAQGPSTLTMVGSHILWASFLWHSFALVPNDDCRASSRVSDPYTPEYCIHKLFQANADNDLSTMEQLTSKDVDMVGYTVAGRKYVG